VRRRREVFVVSHVIARRARVAVNLIAIVAVALVLEAGKRWDC
jgi:hypothetical protein